MLSRLTRIVGSLAAVISTYLAYSLTVAALIEPPAPALPNPGKTGSAPSDLQNLQRQRLRRFFHAGDWELTGNPIILEAKQGTVMMLLERYEQMPEGGVLLEPFSMVLLPADTSGDDLQRDRRAIVLRAPDGAVLHFDKKIDLKRGKIGKLTGGRLRGKITIHSQQRSPGPEDDLRIVASEVQMTENRIWSVKPVGFQLGPNHGSGRHLEIDLVPDHQGEGNLHGPNIGGVRSFELSHDVSMWIAPDTIDLGIRPKKEGDDDAPAKPKPPEPPVELTCRGPLRFDAEKYVATFHDEVNLVRMNHNGPSDYVSCEILSLFFESRDGTPAPREVQNIATSNPPKLIASQIEAIGSPVVVRALSEDFEARGQFLRYDLKTRGGTIWVSGQSVQDAWVRRAGDEIHGRQLYFEPPGDDQPWGRFEAQGTGRLTGTVPDDPTQQISASWTGRAKLRPLDGLLVASLEGAGEGVAGGRVRVDLPNQGHVEADEIHIWLRKPPTGGSPGVKQPPRPDRLLAQGNVRIDSPRLTGNVNAVEVWFDQPSDAQRTASTVGNSGGNVASTERGRYPTTTEPYRVAADAAASTGQQTQEPDKPLERFDVSGGRLRLRVLLTGREPDITEVMIEDDVRLVQTRLADPSDRPLMLSGDYVHLVQPTPETATVTVSGTEAIPAHVEAQGLTLVGREIHLDRGANSLWVDSPGTMTYPIDRDLEGNRLAQPLPMTITWQRRMDFDGRRAVFDQHVEARQARQWLQTERLEVTLAKTLKFQEKADRDNPEVESLTCHGPVYLERHVYEQGKLDSVQRIQAFDMTMNRRTGLVKAAGPGWLKAVRVDTGDLLRASLHGPSRAVHPAVARTGDEPLTYLGVEFEDRLVGNIRQRQQQITFYGQVRSTYGNVENWKDELSADNLDALGERGATLSCHELTVAEGGRNAQGKRQVELIARGNVRAEGTLFTALADRMTYAQAKDLVVLEGDGRAPAELYYRKQVGARDQQASARKISYWRAAGHVDVSDATKVDLNLSQMPRLDRQAPVEGPNRR